MYVLKFLSLLILGSDPLLRPVEQFQNFVVVRRGQCAGAENFHDGRIDARSGEVDDSCAGCEAGWIFLAASATLLGKVPNPMADSAFNALMRSMANFSTGFAALCRRPIDHVAYLA